MIKIGAIVSFINDPKEYVVRSFDDNKLFVSHMNRLYYRKVINIDKVNRKIINKQKPT
jgi:hypothetical protein